MINLNAWFQKHDLCAENILYIYRKDRKTVIQRTDGAEFALFVPVHSILSALPEKNFLSISKGIVVCRSHIVNISNDGVYTMSDGRTFQGRKRKQVIIRTLTKKAVPLDGSKFYFFGLVFVFISSGRSSAHGSILIY